MAIGLLIGMMKCSIDGNDGGSIKSASLSIKPTWKEHKSGYPPASDLKVLVAAEATLKAESEEKVFSGAANKVIASVISGNPEGMDASGVAPGIGASLNIAVSGWGSGASIYGKAEDFGYCGAEVTGLSITGGGGGGGGGGGSNFGGVDFLNIDRASQAVTNSTDSLIFGGPEGPDGACASAQGSASIKVKYFMLNLSSAVLDGAVMESADASFTANYTSAVAVPMETGYIPVGSSFTLSCPTIGGSAATFVIGNGFKDADVSFNPGNDWNGYGVKYTAIRSLK